MDKLFLDIEQNYFLNIGDGKLSPISQGTIGLCMTYIENFQKEEFEKKPLVIGLPSKQWATIWLSAGIMTNLFHKEIPLLNQGSLNDLNLKEGDKIRIFGRSTIWKGFNQNGKGQILVSQSIRNSMGMREDNISNISLAERWIPFIERDLSNNKSIISAKLLNKKIQEKRTKETTIEKILNYKKKKDLGINSNSLTSKLLMVTGRGDKGKFIRQLKQATIYNDSLAETFMLNKNILVEVDLENYISLTDSQFVEKAELYKKRADKILTKIKVTKSSSVKILEDLIESLKSGNYLSSNFKSELEKLLDLLEEEEQDILEDLYDAHPGVETKLPDSLKVVILNDIHLVETYPRVIGDVCKKGIPVIILSDFYSDFQDDLIDDYYRFFWNTPKIKYLLTLEEKENLLDKELWKLAKRFSGQFIGVEQFDNSEIEDKFSQLSRSFYSVEGFEKLKKIYWKSFFPLFNLIKNSPNKIDFSFIERHLEEFSLELEKLKGQLPSIISEPLNKILSNLSSGFYNPKNLVTHSHVYQQDVDVNESCLSVPFSALKNVIKIKQTSSKNHKITFTGEPYKEKYTEILKKACLYDFIPEITVLCWKSEGAKILRYLTKLYKEHYFTDNVSAIHAIPHQYNLITQDTINSEVNEIIMSNEDVSNSRIYTPTDDLFIHLRKYNHTQYKQSSKEESISANILNFRNGDWMYLPKGSKVLTVNLRTDGVLIIKKTKWNELKPRIQIIQYSLDNTVLRKIAKNKSQLYETFDDLNIWREALENLYNCFDGSTSDKYAGLEKILDTTNKLKHKIGNPSRGNLVRWRNDTELLAPLEGNLRLILEASEQIEQIDKVLLARKKVLRFNNQIRREIKYEAIEKMKEIFDKESTKNSFSINIKGFGIKINIRTILSLEQEPVDVSYSVTRKIISD